MDRYVSVLILKLKWSDLFYKHIQRLIQATLDCYSQQVVGQALKLNQ